MRLPLVILVLFWIYAAFLYRGRGTWLLAGWNTMKKEKQEKFQQAEYFKLCSKGMAVIGMGMFFTGLGVEKNDSRVVIAGLSVVGISILAINIIPVWKPDKYKKK